MANRYAVASGNWSNTATWDGGTLPGPSDVVRGSGQTITIDQDVDVAEIRFNVSAPAAAGGKFIIASVTGTRTITVPIINGISGASPPLIDVTAPSGTVVINSAIQSGASSSTIGVSGGATVIINGSVTAGTGSAGHGALVSTSAPLIINGPLNGGTHGGAHGIQVNNGSNPNVTINGDVRNGGTLAGAGVGINVGTGAGSITVNGDVYGSTTANAAGINTSGGDVVVVTGDVFGATGPGINASGNAVVDVIGAITAGASQPGLVAPAVNSLVRITGPLIDSTTQSAIWARAWLTHVNQQLEWTMTKQTVFGTNDGTITLRRYGAATPPVDDVRLGVEYGPANDEGSVLVGTLHMPPASAVADGIAVDDTVGTASTAAGIWDYPTSAATTAGSMGARLRNAATVESTGAQLAATLGE